MATTVFTTRNVGYIGDLRSKTQGRAMFTMQMDSYAEVPKNVSEEIIKAQRGE